MAAIQERQDQNQVTSLARTFIDSRTSGEPEPIPGPILRMFVTHLQDNWSEALPAIGFVLVDWGDSEIDSLVLSGGMKGWVAAC